MSNKDTTQVEVYSIFAKTEKKVLIVEEDQTLRNGSSEAFWWMPIFFSKEAAHEYLKRAQLEQEYKVERCVVFAEPIKGEDYTGTQRTPVGAN